MKIGPITKYYNDGIEACGQNRVIPRSINNRRGKDSNSSQGPWSNNKQRACDHWSVINGRGQDINTYYISSQGLLQEQIESRRSLEYYPRGRVGLQYLFYFQLGTIVGTNREQETIGILSTGEGRIAIHILSRNHVVLTNGEQETIRILSFDSTILHSIIKMVLFSNLYNNPFQNITLSSISLQSIKQSILHDYSLYKRTAQK